MMLVCLDLAVSAVMMYMMVELYSIAFVMARTRTYNLQCETAGIENTENEGDEDRVHDA